MLELGLNKSLTRLSLVNGSISHYQLIRSKRKTLSLQINNDTSVIVRSPQYLSIEKIEIFIQKKSIWIERKIQELQKRSVTKPTYLNGDKFLYLGNYYPLIRQKIPRNKLKFNGCNFKLSNDNNGADEFYHWYKTAFKAIALPRLDYYSNMCQLKYKKVRVKSQKTIWGSCSNTNNINLNYLLICAPISVIDYVIVHELSHIKHKNHSKAFWDLLKSILPNYKIEKKWLKDNGQKLQNL